jgi:hypothetical protein
MDSRLLTSLAITATVLGTPVLVTLPVPAPVAAQTQPQTLRDIKKAVLNQLDPQGTHRSQIKIRKTTVEGSYAVVGWTWGEGGGETALLHDEGFWQVQISGGGAINVSDLMNNADFPAHVARRIMRRHDPGYSRE